MPGRSEKEIPVMKDALCLLEGVPSDDRGEDLRVRGHWVRVANRGPDARTVHDGQVVGWWEGVEEQWKAADAPPSPNTFDSSPERTGVVLQQLEPMLGGTLSPQEKEEVQRWKH